jgi:hypothetical protein
VARFPDVWRARARVEDGSPDERFVLERVTADVERLSDALNAFTELAAEASERAAGRHGLAVQATVNFGRGLDTRPGSATTEKLGASFTELGADRAAVALGAAAEMTERVFGGRSNAEEEVGSPVNEWSPGGRPTGTWPRPSETGWWSLDCWLEGTLEERSRRHSIRSAREGDDLDGALAALVEAGEEAITVPWREHWAALTDPFVVQGDLRWYPPNPAGEGHVRFAPQSRLLASFREVPDIRSALVALEVIGDAAGRVYGGA